MTMAWFKVKKNLPSMQTQQVHVAYNKLCVFFLIFTLNPTYRRNESSVLQRHAIQK